MGRQRSVSGVPEKQWWWWAAGAQIEEIQRAVGGAIVKPSADLWRFVRWATTSPLTTAAAASGSSVDSQTISVGPPLTRQLMYYYYLFIKTPTSQENTLYCILHSYKRITDKKYHSICIKSGSIILLKYVR